MPWLVPVSFTRNKASHHKVLSFKPAQRNPKSSKYDYGHVLVIGSSPGMMGAGVLCAKAAMRSGCGLVTLALRQSMLRAASAHVLEEMLLGLSQDASKACVQLKKFIHKRHIRNIVIGPGLGRDKYAKALVRSVCSLKDVTVVLDADSIYHAGAMRIHPQTDAWVITPHAKEFESYFHHKALTNDVSAVRLLSRLSFLHKCVVVYKSWFSLVVSERRYYCLNKPNTGLAKAGSGDVLSGLIGSFVAQGQDVFEAACWAVYCHNQAAAIASKRKSPVSMIASDVIDALSNVSTSKRLTIRLVRP